MAAFYRSSVAEFLAAEPAKLLLALTTGTAGMGFDLKADQHAAWLEQAEILARSLRTVEAEEPAATTWSILLEYQIPGRPKRLDAVLLDGHGIIAVEFKVGADEFRSGDKWQLREYCWNLRDFHRESEGIPIAPVLVATRAPLKPFELADGFEDKHHIILPMQQANADTLATSLIAAHAKLAALGQHPLDLARWDASQTHMTRTVIEEAQRLFQAHDVREVSHAHADNTTDAQEELLDIVRRSRKQGLYSICFLTGVPGAGKTLVGLHAAYSPAMAEAAGEPACFASGNQPLLDVLHAALTLNRTRDGRNRREVGHELSAPVQNVHDFALRNLLDPEKRAPTQHVVVFDEAQRVWTGAKVEAGLKKRVQRGAGRPWPGALFERLFLHVEHIVVELVRAAGPHGTMAVDEQLLEIPLAGGHVRDTRFPRTIGVRLKTGDGLSARENGLGAGSGFIGDGRPVRAAILGSQDKRRSHRVYPARDHNADWFSQLSSFFALANEVARPLQSRHGTVGSPCVHLSGLAGPAIDAFRRIVFGG